MTESYKGWWKKLLGRIRYLNIQKNMIFIMKQWRNPLRKISEEVKQKRGSLLGKFLISRKKQVS